MGTYCVMDGLPKKVTLLVIHAGIRQDPTHRTKAWFFAARTNPNSYPYGGRIAHSAGTLSAGELGRVPSEASRAEIDQTESACDKA